MNLSGPAHKVPDSPQIIRSSHPELFLRKAVLKICSKFTGEHSCRSAISIKLLCNFIEITLRHGCSPVNLMHVLRTPFLKKTSGRLLLDNAGFNLSLSSCYFDDVHDTLK